MKPCLRVQVGREGHLHGLGIKSVKRSWACVWVRSGARIAVADVDRVSHGQRIESHMGLATLSGISVYGRSEEAAVAERS